MRDYERTVISQYSNSPILTRLVDDLNVYIDPDANLESFYNLIWNIETAVGYGLDVWGRIVGVNRVLHVGLPSQYFGFQEAVDRTGFDQAPFYAGQVTTFNYILTDEAYRELIFAKAAQNITDSSIPAINKIMMNLFPNRGNAYVIDGNNTPTGETWFGFQEATDRTGFDQSPFGDYMPTMPGGMSMVYVFDFVLEPFEIAIVTQSGVLPKPVGVFASTLYLT